MHASRVPPTYATPIHPIHQGRHLCAQHPHAAHVRAGLLHRVPVRVRPPGPQVCTLAGRQAGTCTGRRVQTCGRQGRGVQPELRNPLPWLEEPARDQKHRAALRRGACGQQSCGGAGGGGLCSLVTRGGSSWMVYRDCTLWLSLCEPKCEPNILPEAVIRGLRQKRGNSESRVDRLAGWLAYRSHPVTHSQSPLVSHPCPLFPSPGYGVLG